jgi:hypothetical protein
MMKKASLHGLAFKNDVDVDGNASKAAISDSYREFMYGAYSKFSPRFYRPIGEPPQNTEDGTNSNVNETIDASVFDRYRADASYRPSNLAEWATRHGVNPAALNQSIRADNPQTVVPD